MAEYIEREKVKEAVKNYGKGAIEDGMKTLDPVDDILLIVGAVDMIPSADVVEVKHGKWEVTEHNAHLNVVCSNCNEDFYVYKKGQYRIDRSNYCPKCGAKMDGKDGANNA